MSMIFNEYSTNYSEEYTLILPTNATTKPMKIVASRPAFGGFPRVPR
jgi:hypothetical protein